MCSIVKGDPSPPRGVNQLQSRSKNVKTAFRVLVTFVSAVSALYFFYWVGGGILLAFHLSAWISFVGSYVIAAVVGFYVWMHTAALRAGLINHIVLGAVTTGGIGFAAG